MDTDNSCGSIDLVVVVVCGGGACHGGYDGCAGVWQLTLSLRLGLGHDGTFYGGHCAGPKEGGALGGGCLGEGGGWYRGQGSHGGHQCLT